MPQRDPPLCFDKILITFEFLSNRVLRFSKKSQAPFALASDRLPLRFLVGD